MHIVKGTFFCSIEISLTMAFLHNIIMHACMQLIMCKQETAYYD